MVATPAGPARDSLLKDRVGPGDVHKLREAYTAAAISGGSLVLRPRAIGPKESQGLGFDSLRKR